MMISMAAILKFEMAADSLLIFMGKDRRRYILFQVAHCKTIALYLMS